MPCSLSSYFLAFGPSEERKAFHSSKQQNKMFCNTRAANPCFVWACVFVSSSSVSTIRHATSSYIPNYFFLITWPICFYSFILLRF